MVQWRQLQAKGRMRKPCEGHTASHIDGKLYLMFGKHEDSLGQCVCPPMQVLDLEKMVLETVEPEQERGSSTVPADREGHSACVIGQRIYIFGGTWTTDSATSYLNDLKIFDVGTRCWSTPVASGTTPIEREGHTAQSIDDYMLIFGGTWVDDEDNSHYFDDLYQLTTVPSLSWRVPTCSGQPPSSREGHTASVLQRQMVVFGGAGLSAADEPVNLNDFHLLDVEMWEWSQPRITGSVPQERRYHSSCIVGNVMHIFGGQYYDTHEDLHFECEPQVWVVDL